MRQFSKYPSSAWALLLWLLVGTACQRNSNPREDVDFTHVNYTTAPPQNKRLYLQKALYQTRRLHQAQQVEKLSAIAFEAYQLNDSLLFKTANRQAYRLAQRLKDTAGLADIEWNFGAYYLKKERYDSAYYHYRKAQQAFLQGDNLYYEAKMLYNMAFIKSRIKDYTGSEILLIRAITLYRDQQKHKPLYKCYNLLGVIYDELGEYPKALRYFTKAGEHLAQTKMSNKIKYQLMLQNNIGLSHQRNGNQDMAVTYFSKSLKHKNLLKSNVQLYARLLDNYTYSRWRRGDSSGIAAGFQEALRLRKSIHHLPGIIINSLHLAQYTASRGDSLKAIGMVKEAYAQAQEINLNRDVLAALKLLAELDTGNSADYLNRYLRLSEGLRESERKTRNKFTRIQFETDQYIRENKKLSYQNLWLWSGAGGLTVILALLALVGHQRNRNKQLYVENLQKKADEKIYQLNLKQQEKQEKARFQERRRIAEDLHDSILGNLFGLRIKWAFVSLSGPPEALAQHQENLEALKSLEVNIRNISQNLQQASFGLLEAPFQEMLDKLIKEKEIIGGFKVAQEVPEDFDWKKLDLSFQVNLYRVVEEALQNCVKHSGCSAVWLRFSPTEEELILEVRDNGKGDESAFLKSNSMGLKNMHSRTRRFQGQLKWHSGSNGTSLKFTFPLQNLEA